MSREMEVWADWLEPDAPMRMGQLRSTPSRGKEVFSFSYDQTWLDAGHSWQLDPDLQFFSGPQYLNATDRPNFGIFLDSSPDRWGRLLMQRREAAQARPRFATGSFASDRAGPALRSQTDFLETAREGLV